MTGINPFCCLKISVHTVEVLSKSSHCRKEMVSINKNMSGHTDYCISPDELVPDIVAEKIKELLQESRNIRAYLEQRIPEIQDLAMNSGRILQKILKET